MIRTFRHAGLEKFYRIGSKAGIQPAHAKKLSLQLFALNTAKTPKDLAVFNWGLHPLKGELGGHYALWVSGNWRLTFTFDGEDVVLLDYLDYH